MTLENDVCLQEAQSQGHPQLALVGWECGSQEVGVEVLTEGEWQEVGFA